MVPKSGARCAVLRRGIAHHLCHGGLFGDESAQRVELRCVVAAVETHVGVAQRQQPVVGRHPEVGRFEVVVRQAGLRQLPLQSIERREQTVAVCVADCRCERLALGGKFLRDQVAGALRAGGVGVGEFPAQHPPREQEFGRMIFEALRRGLREPVGERRERAEQPQPAIAERTLRLGEERRAFEQQCARPVLCEAGFAQRAERCAGREQLLHEAVDRREHGYWRFTLIDPTLRIESSSVIDAL